MRYRKLGSTGLEVSELSLGAARGARQDPREFVATVRACVAAGINFVDTAESYEEGECERMLGEALRGHPDVLVETKYRPYDSHRPDAAFTGTAEALTASVEASLRRLGRERVDVLLGHGIRTMESLRRFMEDGCWDAMRRLREAGKARFIGLSELSEGDGTHEVLKKAVPTGALDVVMLTVNVLLQTAIDELLPLCRKHGVGTVVMMPLNQASRDSGLVSVQAALECVRRHVKEGTLPAAPPYTERTLFDFLAPYSVPEASLRFALSQDVSTVCVGMRSSRRLTENLRALGTPYLDAGRASRIRELFGSIRRQVR